MRINPKFQLVLFCCMALIARAQNVGFPSLDMGDPAPPLRVREWLKGTPVQKFQKGKVYVLEFWATWCGPCIAAMPHLSDLAREYNDKVIFIGIDIKEKKTTPLRKVKAFVDSMGRRMDYVVATDNNNFMVTNWMEAAAEQGIPQTFVVDGEGRLAWIGHPKDLSEVLQKIVTNTWDLKEAVAKRYSNRHLEMLDRSASNILNTYLEKPDSALLLIDMIVRNEPELKYSPYISSHTFSALLRTDPHKAYEYGKVVLRTSTYAEPDCNALIASINWCSEKLNLPAEIYLLGAEAYQVKTDRIAYPQLANIFRNYNYMAEYYWRANDKSKAIAAQQKAIEAMKSRKPFSATEMAEFESRLQQYTNK